MLAVSVAVKQIFLCAWTLCLPDKQGNEFLHNIQVRITHVDHGCHDHTGIRLDDKERGAADGPAAVTEAAKTERQANW